MAAGYRIRGPNETTTFTDISEYFPAYTLDLTMNAEEGSVATSQMTADDPTGVFDYVGHRQFRAYETSATGSNTVIYAGYTAEREWWRGDDYRTTNSRIVDVTLTDINTVLSRRVIRGSDGNRPAETDVARMQWVEASNEASLIDDTRYLSTAAPVHMDACDYRGQYVADVMNDCGQASGKDWFLWYAEDTDEFSLWYDFSTSSNYRSPIRLSNKASDIDNVWTFAISSDTKLRRDPSRVYSGVQLPYDGGTVYETDAETANTFALSGRDVVMPSYNVKSEEKASARAQRYLADLSSEEDTITTAVYLPAAKVNMLMQGMAVQIKATHLPGYESFYWGRALNRNVVQVSEEQYKVTLELTMTGPSVPDAGDQTPESSDVIGAMDAMIEEGVFGGNNAYSEDLVVLYDGCTYSAAFAVSHNHGGTATSSNYIHVSIWRDYQPGDSAPDQQIFSINFGAVRTHSAFGSWEQIFTLPIPAFGVAGVTSSHYQVHMLHSAYFKTNGWGSSAHVVISYVSGPDPRFT